MRSIGTFLGFCAALVVSYATADTIDLKASLSARYAALRSAIAARDTTALASLLTPDFVSKDAAGVTETAAQMISEVSSLNSSPHKISATTLLSVAQSGDIATVKQRYETRTTKPGPDGKPHEIVLATLSTDTWVNAKGVWLLSRTVTDDLSYSVDGTVVAHETAK